MLRFRLRPSLEAAGSCLRPQAAVRTAEACATEVVDFQQLRWFDKGGYTGASVNDMVAGSSMADNGKGFKGASSHSSSATKVKGKFIGHMTMDIHTWHGRHVREFMHEQGVQPGEFIAILELTAEVMHAAHLVREG